MHDHSSLSTARVLRALGVAALSVALAAVPVAAQAAPGNPSRPVNHAPDRPTAVRTTSPDSECSTTAPARLRSTVPTLRAVLSDRDGDQVRGLFTVRQAATGRLVWSSRFTLAQMSGSEHAVQVPEGLLQDGGQYEWRVQARDTSNRPSPTVRCRIDIDTVAPGQPTITAVEGGGALYAEDSTAGGVGIPGAFRLEAPAADGVVAFQYAFDGGQRTVDVAPGETGATITWTPTTAGTHRLTAQAVDAAGNVGAERLYRFTVASAAAAPVGNARWTLDEGTGSTAADVLATDGATALTLAPSVTWTAGLRNELAGATDDLALLIDDPADVAATTGPVVDTAGSWAVVALVKPADADASGTVVSQGTGAGDGFRLGVSGDGCPDDLPTCWALSVDGTDGPTTATSAVPVSAGAWYVVFGVRDAVNETVRVDVCALGTAEEPGRPVAVAGTRAALVGGTPASGQFRVGGAPDGTVWSGVVSGVRTWGGVIDSTTERVLCSRGA